MDGALTPANDIAGRPRFAYQPALDGLRCLSVVAVLLFHDGVGWMSGGYLGVSVFFTLSGFLITSLLLAEHDTTGTISPAAFYGRRVKRLLPASLLCLLGVVVLAETGTIAADGRLRGDVLAALGQVFNWRTLFSDQTYAQLLGSDSAVAHFWSLAVEEQFYWVWPLVALATFRWCRSSRARSRVLIGLFAVSAAVPVWTARTFGADAAYWATPARLSEILAGAALAAVIALGRPPRRWVAQLIGLAGVAVLGWAMATWPRASGPAYEGWLPLIAVASAAVILGLQHEAPLARVLSWRPFVAVGKISYGVYLYHWPIFVVLTPSRVGTAGWTLFAIRAAVTLAVATVSYFAVELPVRRSSLPAPRTLLAGLTALAVFGVVLTTVPAWEAAADDEIVVPDGPGFTPTPTTTPPDPTTPGPATPTTTAPPDDAPAEPRPVPSPLRILVVGDSTAYTLAGGFNRWLPDHDEAQMEFVARPGCGLMTGSHMAADEDQQFQDDCDEQLSTALDDVFATAVPDVALILVTLPDAVDRTWPDGTVRSPGDPVYEAERERDYQAFADRLHAAGVRTVVWMRAAPPSRRYYDEHPDQPWGAVRTDLVNATIDGLDGACTIDYAKFVAAREDGGDTSLRRDGLHIDIEAWPEVIDGFLWDQLVDRVQHCE